MYPLGASERVEPAFLLMIVLGEPFSRYAESVSARSGFPKINRGEIAGFRLALPERQEQIRAAKVYWSADERIVLEEARQRKLMLIKTGLMHDLLTGRVPVPEKLIDGLANGRKP
jgi:type I restriction enzyme S subunit